MSELVRESLTEKQRVWLQHLEDCAASGLSMAAYAAEHDLRVGSLYVWKQNLKRRGLLQGDEVAPIFDLASVNPEPERAPISCTVRFPNGCSLELSSLSDQAALVSLVSAMASLP